jgi:hypothetical protein
METSTTFATLVVLALSGLAASAQTRVWVGPLPEKKETASAGEVLKFEDTSINYGPRVRVRVLRPEGVYEIDNTHAEKSDSGKTDR